MHKIALIAVLCLGTARCLLIEEDCLIFPIYPVQYEITLSPYLTGDRFYYEGDITIVVIATAARQNTIELDCKDLQIHEDTVSVLVDNRNIVDQRRPISVDQRRGKIVIYLRESLRSYGGLSGASTGRDQYRIKMRFRGNVNKGDAGLFATSYKDGNTVKWALSSRLPPQHASEVFPCFDNPHLEAGFLVHLYAPAQLPTVLAVSSQVRTLNTSSYTLFEFSPSPQIPTHKLALHMSEFVPRRLPPADQRAPVLVLWSRPREDQPPLAMVNFANRVLGAQNAYAPWSRAVTLNVVALPNYWRGYERSAWSLLTVGESRFLVEPELMSVSQLEAAELDLSTQLSRVWLASPQETVATRWKQEWFKEGMATYFGQYFLAWGDMFQRDYESLGLRTLFRAMAADTRSRPLSSFNITSADALSKEDEELITLKTASILRMLEHWLKTEEFHKALKDYLNSRRGKTISLEDLAEYLQRGAAARCEWLTGHSLGALLSSFVTRPGHPVLQVTVYRDSKVVSVSQRHFDLTGAASGASSFLVPVSFALQFPANCLSCRQPRFLLAAPEYTFKENLAGGWILLNTRASGYYRVNYDDENWKLLIKTLSGSDRNQIDTASRAQIMNDAFALHASSLMSLELATELVSTLRLESEMVVWEAAAEGFLLLRQGRPMHRDTYQYWKNLMAKQVSEIYRKMARGAGSDLNGRAFRRRIVSLACSVGLPACLDDMAAMNRPSHANIEPDLRETCYQAVLARDGSGWRQLRPLLDAADPYQREDILSAKQASDDEKVFNRSLQDGPENISLPTKGAPPSADCCRQTSHIKDPCCQHRTGVNSARALAHSVVLVVIPAAAFLTITT